MAVNMTGAGFFFKRDSDGLHPLFLAGFSLAETLETVDAEGYPVNDISPLQILDTVTTKSTWELTANIQAADKLDINEWVFGQKEGTISSIAVPVTGSGIVTSGVITVTGLTVDQVVDVTVLSDTSPGKTVLTQIASAGTPSAGEYEVTSNTITFNAAQEGLAVSYYYLKTETSLQSIGGTNTLNPVEEFEMMGKFNTTRTQTINIWLPKCKFSSGTTFAVGGDSFERTMKVLVPTGLGWKVPYLKWESA
jgi:hypothetical protein